MIRIAAGILIAALFLYIVHVSTGLSALAGPWRILSPLESITGVLLLFFSYVVRSLRMYDYFIINMRGRFGTCLRMVVYHTFFNNMLPMRSGELAFPILMKRYFGVDASRTLPALMWFRALDLHILLFAGTLCLIFYTSMPGGFILIPVALLITPTLVLPARKVVYNITSHGTSRLTGLINRLIEGIPGDIAMFCRQWLFTVLNWSIKLAVFAWIMQRFVKIPYATALLAGLLGETSTILPVQGIAGAGTYEGGIMLGLRSQADSVQALNAALGVHVFVLGSITITAVVTLLMTYLFANTGKSHE